MFPLSTGHYQKMTLRLKPAVVSFTGVAGSYFPQGSGSQFGMHSRVTWGILKFLICRPYSIPIKSESLGGVTGHW